MFGGERRTFEEPKQSTCYEIWAAAHETSMLLLKLWQENSRTQFGEASRSDSGVVGFKGAVHLSEGTLERETNELMRRSTQNDASLQCHLLRTGRFMHMPTLENAASRSIGEQLRIGDGKTQWTIRFAQRRPEAVDVTVHEKGRRVEAMREEGAVLEIDSPAFVGIVEDA